MNWISILLTRRRYLRAHAGKLRCERMDCRAIATRQTPAGFFCGDHWQPRQTIRTEVGNTVTYAFDLDFLRLRR